MISCSDSDCVLVRPTSPAWLRKEESDVSTGICVAILSCRVICGQARSPLSGLTSQIKCAACARANAIQRLTRWKNGCLMHKKSAARSGTQSIADGAAQKQEFREESEHVFPSFSSLHRKLLRPAALAGPRAPDSQFRFSMLNMIGHPCRQRLGPRAVSPWAFVPNTRRRCVWPCGNGLRGTVP